MNNYQIYYSIKSADLFRSVHDSTPYDHIDELSELVDSLVEEDDLISIYTTETKLRIQIWGEKDINYCTLEINNALRGINFFKKLSKKAVKNMNVEILENYIAHPEAHDFNSEVF